MPEGDSIHRIAIALADLVGAPIERATTQGLVRPALAGQAITAIAARGKHLVIDTANGTQVRAHLGMYGRFHRHPRAEGEARLARTSPGRASLALVLPAAVLVWLGAKAIEISDRRAPRRGLALATLGPDVTAADFDAIATAARVAPDDPRPIASVLLDQRVAAGIGNVYKSEVLFLVGVDPRTATADVPAEIVTELYREANRLMRANLDPRLPMRQTTMLHAPVRSSSSVGPRSASPIPGSGLMASPAFGLRSTPAGDERFFVYGRGGQPCRRCASQIACFALGDPPRWTWACPVCQPRPRPT